MAFYSYEYYIPQSFFLAVFRQGKYPIGLHTCSLQLRSEICSSCILAAAAAQYARFRRAGLAILQARRLSSAAVLPEVDLIEQQMQYEIADSTIINTNFVNITCQEIVDTAWCDCLIEFEGEEYPDRYRLLRVNGQWLMDRRPENPDEMQGDSLLLDLFKEMLESE